MSGDAFIDELVGRLERGLARIEASSQSGDAGELTVLALLPAALRNEFEAVQVAAAWIPTTEDPDLILLLARQVGDEGKHYRLIAERLADLGFAVDRFDPREGGMSPLSRHLIGLPTAVERIAGALFAREGIALVRNRVFIAFARERGDVATARLYEEVIQPDEEHHHRAGMNALRRAVKTDADREAAVRAVDRTLELVTEAQEIARMKRGLARLPGC